MTKYLSLFLFLLTACALQPVTEPRRFDPALEPTLLPARVSAEKPTYPVERGTVAELITLQGRVGSMVEVSVAAEREGRIAAVLVQSGAAVVAGDALALLDTGEIDGALAEVARGLESAETQLAPLHETLTLQRDIATLTLERANLQLTAAQEQGATETELRVLQIDVNLAQIALDQIETNPNPELQLEIAILQQQRDALLAEKEQMRLVVSADGDLINFNLQAGARVREGQTIGTLVNLDQTILWADANEGTLAQLEEGMSVQLSLPNSEETFIGMIERLPFPHGVGGGRDGAVGIAAENLPPLASRVNVTITLAVSDDTLWLPPAALREFAGQPFVIVRNAESEQRVDIELGLTSAGRVEVLDSLREGDVIVAP